MYFGLEAHEILATIEIKDSSNKRDHLGMKRFEACSLKGLQKSSIDEAIFRF